MQSDNTIISLRDVTVVRGGQEIIHGITFDVGEGDIAVIIGPNGSGKSTLLKAMLGLLPASGDIIIAGNEPDQSLAMIGYVPQRFSFDAHFPLTVKEFLALFSQDQDAVHQALDEVEMDMHYAKQLGKLSGGQLQRVLIARALVNQPKLLLLDEPTAGIDQEGEKDFYEIIQHQNKEHGVTIVMISHEINIVYKYATQVICLNNKLCCVGAPHEALTKEVLEELYGGDATVHQHSH